MRKFSIFGVVPETLNTAHICVGYSMYHPLFFLIFILFYCYFFPTYAELSYLGMSALDPDNSEETVGNSEQTMGDSEQAVGDSEHPAEAVATHIAHYSLGLHQVGSLARLEVAQSDLSDWWATSLYDVKM